MNTRPELPGSASLGEKGPRSLELSPAQQRLHRALGEKDAQLANWYEGALLTFSNDRNPDCLAQAAHTFREVMEKLPRREPLPETRPQRAQTKGVNLTTQVRKLEKAHDRFKKVKKPTWQSANEILRSLEEFLGWVRQHRPSRSEATRRELRRLDPFPVPMPEALEKINVQAWEKIRDFFELTSHHSLSPSREEFGSWQAALERFLLDRLVPRTFDEQREIESLMQKAVTR